MALPYAVVSFLNDEDNTSDEENQITSEVPSLWVSKDKTKCWWPKTKNVTSYILKRVQPTENSIKWEQFDIKLEGFYESIEKARKRAEFLKSEDKLSTDNRSCKVNGHYLRKHYQRIRCRGENNTSDQDEEQLCIPNAPNFSTSKGRRLMTSDVNDNVLNMPNIKQQKQLIALEETNASRRTEVHDHGLDRVHDAVIMNNILEDCSEKTMSRENSLVHSVRVTEDIPVAYDVSTIKKKNRPIIHTSRNNVNADMDMTRRESSTTHNESLQEIFKTADTAVHIIRNCYLTAHLPDCVICVWCLKSLNIH